MALQQLSDFLSTLQQFFESQIIKTSVYAIIAILIGIIIMWIINSQVKRLTERNVISPAASDRIRKALNIAFLFFLFLVVLYIATSNTILLIVVIIGIAAGFAASWKVLANVIAHYALILSKHIAQGEYIEINGMKGRIKSIGLIHTLIRTEDDSLLLVPNVALLEKMVKHVGMERTLILRVTLNISNPNDLADIEEKIDSILATRFRHSPRTGEFGLSIERINESTVSYLVKTNYLGTEERETVASTLVKHLYEGLSEYEPSIEIVRMG